MTLATTSSHATGFGGRVSSLACALALGTTLCSQAAWAQAPAPEPTEDTSLDLPLDLSLPSPRPEGGAEPSSDAARGEESWRREGWQPYAKTKPADRFMAARRPSSGWEAKVGVDGGAQPAPFTPQQWTAGVARDAPGVAADASSGVAWANVTAPGLDLPLSWDKASLETRIDPAQEQGKLGTTFSRSVPIGDTLSVTLQNGFSVTGALGSATSVAAPPASAGTSTSANATQVFGNSETLRLGILPTDTTLAISAAKSSNDEKWLRSLGAEQKLFGGPFSVSGSVNETASGELSKSIKAGFKHAW